MRTARRCCMWPTSLVPWTRSRPLKRSPKCSLRCWTTSLLQSSTTPPRPAPSRVRTPPLPRRTPAPLTLAISVPVLQRVVTAHTSLLFAPDAHANTVLHYAAFQGNAAVVKHLVALTVPQNKNLHHCTPRHCAAMSGSLEALELCDDQPVAAHIDTALHKAAYFGRSEVVARLLATGAAVNAAGSMEQTALHKVSSRGERWPTRTHVLFPAGRISRSSRHCGAVGRARGRAGSCGL